MKRLKRLSLLALSLMMTVSLIGCTNNDIGKNAALQQKDFDTFMNSEFVDSLQDSYVNMYNFTENPENYGIDKSKVTVQINQEISEATFKENRASIKKSAKKFNEFDRASLTSQQQDTYDTYQYMLDYVEDMSAKKYDYMSIPLESMTGIHSQLPTLFSDWTLRDEQSVKDVITLMKSVRLYIDSILQYIKKQEEKGTLMINIDNVKEYCQKVIDADVNSSVLSGLNKSIEELQLGDELTKQYQGELKSAFQEYFIPSYQDIIETLDSLDSSKNNTLGLSHLKNGKEYYELLFKEAVGTDKSIKEIKQELEELAGSSIFNVAQIAQKDPKVYQAYTNGLYKTNYHDFESMLKDLETDIQEDFPPVGDLDYNIAPIGEDLASGGVAAYYNIPALDGTTPKKIRVNMLKDALDIQSMGTFSTLAHEGLPGHMYQIAYQYKNIKDNWSNVLANCPGYTEGYATYAGMYALKYLDGLPQDVITLQQNMTVYQNCLIALADIGIHYDGWTVDDTNDFLKESGMMVGDTNNFYKQIQANPTAFLSYYVGYSQIAKLKEEAQDKLKDKFSDLGFHQALLKSGSAPFKVVERNILEYINKTK